MTTPSDSSKSVFGTLLDMESDARDLPRGLLAMMALLRLAGESEQGLGVEECEGGATLLGLLLDQSKRVEKAMYASIEAARATC